jgi:hypothetical protein
MTENKLVAFVVGTGRCGTTFLAEVASREKSVAVSHCRDPLVQTFHRYCKWNELDVDDAGVRAAFQRHIDRDHARQAVSLECSPYVSLSVDELARWFDARFVMLVREPVGVVQSHLSKGWYAEPFRQADPHKALGYQDCSHFHHFLGRIAPRGDEFEVWNRLTQVGKCAWYWAALNKSLRLQLESLPSSQWRVFRLEELDYAAYQEFAAFCGYVSVVTAKDYEKIARAKPNSLRATHPSERWSEQEWSEFRAQVADEAEHWGYDVAN